MDSDVSVGDFSRKTICLSAMRLLSVNNNDIRGSGGIGRHAYLAGYGLWLCGFKSCRTKQLLKSRGRPLWRLWVI